MTTDPTPRNDSSRAAGIFSMLWTILTVALVMATLFTMWTPDNLFSNRLLEGMISGVVSEPTSTIPTPTPLPRARIGIVAGHYGNDSGAVCADGLTEMQVNLEIATRVQRQLQAEGFEVDLLQEFDDRLTQYQALALISIHNDSCEFVNDEATGFKVAAAASSLFPEKADRLNACLIDRYGKTTGMLFHPNTITGDMREYHTFKEINSNTTAAIIETGFLNLDRAILTEQPELVATGITNGILCFIYNEPVTITNTNP